jgi:Tubulin/FtsZ family, GTPase domain
MLIPAQHEVRMNIKLQVPTVTDLKPRIIVIGVGGAGGNAINNMIASGLDGVEFVVANTDAQALATSSAEHRLQLGVHLTEGLGAGSKPEIGEAAAEEAIEDIRAAIAGSHMVFVAQRLLLRVLPRRWVSLSLVWSPSHLPLKARAACASLRPASPSWANTLIR